MSVDAPDDLMYTESHEWIETDGDIARIGLTDYAQNLIGDIISVSLPEDDEPVVAGDCIASAESLGRVWEMFSPVNGIVATVNPDLFEHPEDINLDPYGAWLVAIKEPQVGVDVMEASEYLDYCAGQ
ncbi:MAG: glycine cleavage system protein H [Coriobacteriales bacterium]|jgi:glycine cleavage system H protein